MRRQIESIDSKRDETLVLISGETDLDVVNESDPRVTPSSIRIRTPFSGKGLNAARPALVRKNGAAIEIPDGVDAIFTSQAAVEKFVPSYYAHLMTPDELAARMKELLGDAVIAAVHMPTSYTTAVTGGVYGLRVNKSGGFDLI
jgi:hypothetical protein